MARRDMSAGKIIEYAIGIYVLSAILPGAIVSLSGANQSGWSTTTILLWDLLGVIIVAGLLVSLYKSTEK